MHSVTNVRKYGAAPMPAPALGNFVALDRPRAIGLLTRWRRADDDRTGFRGHTYRESHRGIPKGLQRVDREPRIRALEVVCE